MNKLHTSSLPWKEIIVSVVFLLLLLCILNPGHFFMPTMLQMTIVIALLIVFSIFAVFIWKEKARDEREQLHRLIAGRWAFLIGTGVLVFGLVVQMFQQKLDLWLIVALGVMVLTKTIGIVWVEKKQ